MPTYPVAMTSNLSEASGGISIDHIPFYRAFEFTTAVLAKAVHDLSEGLFAMSGMALVNVNGDFRGELLSGDTVFEVSPQRVGSSSLTIRLEIWQNDESAAIITATLVKMDAQRHGSSPFTPEQKAALERSVDVAS